MEKMTFREAQLLVKGARPAGDKRTCVELNELQKFHIGDCVEVVEISLEYPAIVLRMADGPESYCEIKMFADWVIDECIEALREVAAAWDALGKNKVEE